MNIELFTAFLLITVVLIIVPGPIVTLDHFDRRHARRARRADHGGRHDAWQRLVAGGDRAGAQLGPRACRPVVHRAALDRRGLSDLARRAGVATRRGGGRGASGDRPHPLRARPAGRAVQSQDDRLLHRLPAAVHRSAAAGGTAASRNVRRLGPDRRRLGLRLGGRGGHGARLVHEAVAASNCSAGSREQSSSAGVCGCRSPDGRADWSATVRISCSRDAEPDDDHFGRGRLVRRLLRRGGRGADHRARRWACARLAPGADRRRGRSCRARGHRRVPRPAAGRRSASRLAVRRRCAAAPVRPALAA